VRVKVTLPHLNNTSHVCVCGCVNVSVCACVSVCMCVRVSVCV